MRILIVTHFLGEVRAHGLERLIARLSTELVGGGDEVALATTWDADLVSGAPGRSARSQPVVPVFRLPAAQLDEMGLPVDAFESRRVLDAVLDNWKPDVVHITLLHGLDPGVVRHVRERGTPVVLDLHSHETDCPRLMLHTTTGKACAGPDGGRACAAICFAGLSDAASRVLARARAFHDAVHAADIRTACSPYLARWYQATCDIPEPRVISPPIVAPAPGLPDRIRPTPGTRRRLNLGLIGGVYALKGPDVAVEAAAGAELGPTQLAIFGVVADRELEAVIRQRAAAAEGLELRLVGAFEPDELSLLLSDVDVLLIPSQCPETYSLAAREAWSRGIPVFASRLGALAEAVRDGENGFTFAHDDPRELGALLQRVVGEPGLLARLRAGAARTEYVTPQQYAGAFREVYAEALGVRAKHAHDVSVAAAEPAELSRGAPPAALAARTRPAPLRRDGSDHGTVFTDIYDRDLWRVGGESSSGPGSQRVHTERLRSELPRLLSRLGIRSLLDLGCGDFNWMRETDLGVELYIGVDVVFDVVLADRLRYGAPDRLFLLRDATRDPLPRADLVLCRDVLIHYPDEDLVRALRAIVASGSRYLLATTFIDRHENLPIVLGDWRPVNLQMPPPSLPPPVDALTETPWEAGFDDKRLALWDLRDLRDV